jgi:methanethiol S-methyltransferase
MNYSTKWLDKKKNRVTGSRWILSSILITTTLAGRVSLLVFVAFLFNGSLNLVQFEFTERATLAWDAFLSVTFFVQHSGMIRRSFRSRFSKIIPTLYYGIFYTIISGIVLALVMVFWQPSRISLYELQNLSLWLARGLFFLAMAGSVWVMYTLQSSELFGIASIKAKLSGKQVKAPEFIVRGPYLRVRHPLYFFVIVMIWSCPDLTVDRLLFNVLWTMWIYLGTFLEERDLLADFGEAYREYQSRVPRLILGRSSSP